MSAPITALVAKLPTQPSVSTETVKIVQAFNTWAYKREQPSDIALLSSVVARAVQQRLPVPLVLYWGKGPRSQMAEPDEICLDFLASMERRIESVYPNGAQFFLLLTDTHAHLNQHTTKDINKYFSDIAQAAHQRGFKSRKLSDVVRSASPNLCASATEVASSELIESLRCSAEKWYFGTSSAAEAAASYFATNMRERVAVETIYPDSIFVTFNGSTMRPLFPATLPIFYMYSLKKGFGVKPWFLNDDGEWRRSFAPSGHVNSVEIVAAE